jgi:hypothetical protein
MADIIRSGIILVLSNFSLVFLIIGLLFSLGSIARAQQPVDQALVIEKLLSWYFFWAIGVGYFYNFVLHAFFGKMTAGFIGWADSPFQFEVATASLGFSVAAFLAAFHGFERRLIAIIGPGFFMLGAAAGHVYQIVTAHNFAPGNAGMILYMDVAIPLFGFLLLWLQHRAGRTGYRVGA